jgi:hypothetical protein
VHAHGQHRHQQPSAAAQPYAGLEQRRIKALSDEQAADLLAGHGMAAAAYRRMRPEAVAKASVSG